MCQKGVVLMGSKIRELCIQTVRNGVTFCMQHAQIVGQAFAFAMPVR